MRAWGGIAAVVLCAPLAFGQDRDEDPEVPPVDTAVYAEALRERFVACLAAEGNTVTDEDRAVLGDVAASLGRGVARGLGGDGCDDTMEARARCAERVRALTCDDLATRLASPGAETPAWAEGYARGLASRVGACAAAEHDAGVLGDDDRAALRAFEAGFGRALGAMTAAGACAVDEAAVPACARSVAVIPCEALGARLADEPAAMARAVTPACAAMLRCGARALDDGGAEPDDATADPPLAEP